MVYLKEVVVHLILDLLVIIIHLPYHTLYLISQPLIHKLQLINPYSTLTLRLDPLNPIMTKQFIEAFLHRVERSLPHHLADIFHRHDEREAHLF